MTVDYRRGSGELFRPLKRAGIPVQRGTLEFGDFAFTGSGPMGRVLIGIERKKTDEIIGCVHDSRFRRRQVGGLLRTYERHAWLLVEGAYEPDKEGILVRGSAFTSKKGNRLIMFREAGFTRERHLHESVAKFLTTMQVKARLNFMRTVSETETVGWLAAVYRWYQKPWASHKSAYVVDETKPEIAILEADSLKRRLAAQLPGVGWVRSKTVDHYFGSIAEMMNGSERDWRRALGMKEGRKTAASVVAAIRLLDV